MSYGCFACMCVCTTCIQYLCRPEESLDPPGIGVRGDCNLPWVLGIESGSPTRADSAP